MEDFKCDYVIGSGPSARVMQISIEKFTFDWSNDKVGAIVETFERQIWNSTSVRLL